jgi:hypothetical protein
MKKLFLQRPDRYMKDGKTMHSKAAKLWKHIHPDEQFDNTKSMLHFRENALLAGLASDNEAIVTLAIAVARDMAAQLTSLTQRGRKELILPAFRDAQMLSIDGEYVSGEAGNGNDYCGGDETNHGTIRSRMTILRFNCSASGIIEPNLPNGLFPHGFDLMLLISNPHIIRATLNFASKTSKASKIFTENVGSDSRVVKDIKRDIIKKFKCSEKTIIIDSEQLINSVKLLLED